MGLRHDQAAGFVGVPTVMQEKKCKRVVILGFNRGVR
jgi:hypothetical protein